MASFVKYPNSGANAKKSTPKYLIITKIENDKTSVLERVEIKT